MTSLSLSLYLANVQRTNCSNPFPRSPLEKLKAVKQSRVCKKLGEGGEESGESGGAINSEEAEVELATQDLIRDLEAEERGEAPVFEVEKVCSRGSEERVEVPEMGGGEVKSEVQETGGRVESSIQRDISDQLSVVDPRIAGILSNMQNSGNITINFHFGGNQK